MKSRCTICRHPLINDINLAVLSGDYTLDELSQKFGRSRSAFHRHKGHLEKKMARTLERLENHRKQASFFKLSAFLDHVQTRVEAAAADGDTDRVYKGSHIGSRIIHQINKMDVPLEPDTAYRLLSSPGPASRDSLLPAGPQIIADLHQALVDQTLAPCPPPEADETAASHPEGPPVPEKIVLPLPHAPASKHQRRQAAKAARKDRQLLRQSLRQQKHLLNGKKASTNPFSLVPLPCLLTNVEREKHPQGGEAQALPAFLELYAPLDTRNPELETPLETPPSDHCPLTTDHCPSDSCPSDPWPLTTDHCSVPPDHYPAEASSAANAPKSERHKSGTKAKRQRRLLRKMLRNQRDIFKAKKLVQNLTAAPVCQAPSPTPADPLPSDPLETRNPELETSFPETDLLTDPWPLTTDHCPSDPCPLPPDHCPLTTDHCLSETGNQEPETDTDLWLSPDPWTSPSEPPPLPLETRNPELETSLLENNPDPSSLIPDPCLSDETARRADELFEISHGYKRNNPPKHIPDRRRDEDFRSRTIFGDVKNILKYM